MKILKLILLISIVIYVPHFPLYSQDYEIIFTKQVNNNDNLFRLKKGKLIQVTNHKRKDSSPLISPDGKFIVFTSERVGWWKIWLMDIDKKEFTQLTNSNSAEYSPSWSPDGSKIVFVSSRDGNEEIYTMKKDGLDLKNITNSNSSDITPYWAVDNKIYYSSQINRSYQITSCNPDGSDKKIITNTNGDKLMPQLSEDLDEILYYSDINGNYEIFTFSISLNRTKRLTSHPLMDIRPRWSPDGNKIVFERGNKGDNHHIFLMDSDGNKVQQLTFKDYNYAPSFVPAQSFQSKQ